MTVSTLTQLLTLIVLTVPLCVFASSTSDSQPLNCSMLEKQTDGQKEKKSFQAKGDKFVDFDWNLSKELNEMEKGNIVISPISLKMVLAMLYEGAKGITAEEIGSALDLNNSTRWHTRNRFSNILQSLQTSEGNYKIKMGTHLFIDEKATPKVEYQCKLRNFYNSDMEKVDFHNSSAAVKVINNWAKNVTEGHIQELIDEAEDHSRTIMMLLNAVYFKGLWEIPFPENQTVCDDFHLSEKEKVKVPLMKTTDEFLYYNMTDLDAQIIKLPYLGKKFAMYVVLPNKKTGLDTLLRALGPERPLAAYIGNMTKTSINLVLPKFEFDFTTSLRPTLEKLGLKSMFSPSAQLQDIADTMGGEGLSVSNVLQKAGISVTEIGTVAYAATVVELMDKFGGFEEKKVDFIADHPFMFFIEDEIVNTKVFVGKVVNPHKAKVNKDTDKLSMSTPTCGSINKLSNRSPFPAQAQCNGNKCSNNDVNNKKKNEILHLTQRFNYFDADLLQELVSEDAGNVLVSPASVKLLLAMILEGAEGSTLTELIQVLRLPENPDEAYALLTSLRDNLQTTSDSKVKLETNSAAFISKSLTHNETYGNRIHQLYGSGVSKQDFSSPSLAADDINRWVSSRTRGLIPTVVDGGMLSPDTHALLVSTLYFKGGWKTEFLPEDTTDSCFYSAPDFDCKLVPMMTKRNEEMKYKYDRNLDIHVLDIPYEDENYSMFVVLPNKRDGIRQLDFDAARMQFPELIDKMYLYELNFKMPRFTVEYGTELTDILKKMKLKEPFSDNADIPYIINNKRSKISAVVHKAKIEVTEKGTKAAAASGAFVVPLMFGLNTINLDIDHPFYFFIYKHDIQTVLFEGRLNTLGGALGQPPLSNNNPQPQTTPVRSSKNQISQPTTTSRRNVKTSSYLHTVNGRT